MMFAQNKRTFEDFKNLHDHYTLEPQKYQNTFNEKGKEILEIVQDWENRLCAKSEGGAYSRYSTNLADKFREEVKKYLPKINSIGLHYD